MSPLLPHPSAYSRRRRSSQQSVIASGRLQLILLEEFHQPPLPKLLRGSLVTSQIPPHTRLQSQTLPSLGHQCEVVRTTQPATQGTGVTPHLQFHDLMLHFPGSPCLFEQSCSLFPLSSSSLSHAQPWGSLCLHIILSLC